MSSRRTDYRVNRLFLTSRVARRTSVKGGLCDLGDVQMSISVSDGGDRKMVA